MAVSAHEGRPMRASRLRPWAALLLAPIGDGVRRRSGTDVVRVLVASIGVFLVGFSIHQHVSVQEAISNAVHPPPGGLSWLVRLAWILGSFGIVALTILVASVARRLEVLRDLAVAVGISYLACIVIQQIFGVTAGFHADGSLTGVDLGFPIPSMAAAAAAALSIRPYLSRGLQRMLEGALLLGLVSGLVDGAGLPFSLVASLLVGWGAAAIAHLIFGSPTGVPAVSEVVALLAELDVVPTTLEPASHQQWGVSRFVGRDIDGAGLAVSIYGRDAEQSQLLAKVGRTMFLRKDVGPFSLTRSQQLEHECYLTLLASTAAPGQTSTLRVSGVVGPARDALVVATPPPGITLADLVETHAQVTDAQLRSIAAAVSSLHAERIAHGSLGPNRIVLDETRGGVIDFERATTFASGEAIAQDAAALLVSLALVSDAQRSVAACEATIGGPAIADALPFLQDVALSSELAGVIKKMHAKDLLKDLRAQGARAAGVEMPELAELRRMSWTTLILAVGTLIGGWALIEVLLKVAGSFSTVKSAEIPWVIVTALIGQVAYIGSAASTLGSITLVVPFFPLVMLELSNSFSGLALGSAGTLAARVRFFQRQGMDATVAVSSGVLVSTASWIVKGGLFLISLPFALGSMDFGNVLHPSGGSSTNRASVLTYIVIGVVVIGIAVGVLLAVPRWRALVAAKVAPRSREVLSHFKVIAGRPLKLAEIFGGQVVAQLAVALALGAALHAYHQSLSLPVILVVLTLGSILGGISPVPGGMGVVEAGMILGLKAAGVPDSAAIASVFLQRLFTAYLPPIAGWFALMWLRRRKYL